MYSVTNCACCVNVVAVVCLLLLLSTSGKFLVTSYYSIIFVHMHCIQLLLLDDCPNTCSSVAAENFLCTCAHTHMCLRAHTHYNDHMHVQHACAACMMNEACMHEWSMHAWMKHAWSVMKHAWSIMKYITPAESVYGAACIYILHNY